MNDEEKDKSYHQMRGRLNDDSSKPNNQAHYKSHQYRGTTFFTPRPNGLGIINGGGSNTRKNQERIPSFVAVPRYNETEDETDNSRFHRVSSYEQSSGSSDNAWSSSTSIQDGDNTSDPNQNRNGDRGRGGKRCINPIGSTPFAHQHSSSCGDTWNSNNQRIMRSLPRGPVTDGGFKNHFMKRSGGSHSSRRGVGNFRSRGNNRHATNDIMFWVDAETTSLDISNALILEIAFVVTDKNFNIKETLDIVINYTEEEIEACNMSEWSRKMFYNIQGNDTKTLMDRVKDSNVSKTVAEAKINSLFDRWGGNSRIILHGSSVTWDRDIMKKQMPSMEERLHYMTLDVTTLLLISKSFYPLVKLPPPKKLHRALSDLMDSMDLYKFLLQNIFVKTDSIISMTTKAQPFQQQHQD